MTFKSQMQEQLDEIKQDRASLFTKSADNATAHNDIARSIECAFGLLIDRIEQHEKEIKRLSESVNRVTE